ncbi:MAG: beta-ketoacyl-[acyl-carrier-protein] synthase family protein [Candidatus Omnitrophica bacterium]|nr:beta-ketoacyl-[acyl-carrier-protein] synthase family protein [Candidatus Omnitrophota bacterium]
MKKRVLITGLGVLSSIGKGRAEYWKSLKAGKPGWAPATLFDTSDLSVHEVGEVKDFDPKVYMGQKGLRSLDRSTKLLVSAAKLAIEDSQFTITEENTDSLGVSVGTTLGSVKSISDFQEVTLREGPRYTNPALFPNTVINSPASQVSIWHNIKGFNTTISTGFTASLDAMKYAYDFIQLNRVKLVYAGGVEEMCKQTFLGFHALKFLSGSIENSQFISCPFDKRRNGIVFSEGSCLLAMEEHSHAMKRKAPVLGEVLGFGTSFDPYRINKYNPKAEGLRRSIQFALKEANLKTTDIDFIVSNANSTPSADRVETFAIKEVFQSHAYKIPISAPKSMTGESFSVSGALSVSAALSVFEDDFIFPTINYKEKDSDCDLDYVVNKSRKARINNVLVIISSPSGNNTCMVLRRFLE